MLSSESLAKIDRAINKYPPDQKRSAVMAALTIAQDEHGHLTTRADGLRRRVPRDAAHRGVRGRHLLRDVRPRAGGKYKVCICTNLPCALSGATEAAEHLKRKLGVDWNEITADGRFKLKEGECFGACGDAPVVLVNNKTMLIGMTPKKLDKWIEELDK